MSRRLKAKKRELRESIEDWYILMENARAESNDAWWLSDYRSSNADEEEIQSTRRSIEKVKRMIVSLKKGVEVDAESCCEEVFGY